MEVRCPPAYAAIATRIMAMMALKIMVPPRFVINRIGSSACPMARKRNAPSHVRKKPFTIAMTAARAAWKSDAMTPIMKMRIAHVAGRPNI